ncbi:MAG: phosphohydrolase, partial [Oscillospiraceae bacterium]
MKIDIPDFALAAINILNKSGYEAYAVGGCVRDSLMGKLPNDWDICTNAHPEKVTAVFDGFKTIPTGLKHGTITIIIDNNPLEITTFRRDGEYSDSRRPDSVLFVPDLKEDLSRRDFTINAMAYSEKDGLIDFFGGRADLEKKLIRCVGEADIRFSEDALRILRAVRFSSVLGFEIEDKTSAALIEKKNRLSRVSPERIAAEMNKLLLGKNVFEVMKKYREMIAEF